MSAIQYHNFGDLITELNKKPELSQFEISGTGKIEIRNTGGSSASEGGMGDGGGAEKGAGITDNGAGKENESGKGTFDEKIDPVRSDEVKEKSNG